MTTTFHNFETPWSEFTGEGENYDLYRPSYPAEVARVIIDHVTNKHLDGAIVDVGSGTGLFTRVLAAEVKGRLSVIGVDPNADMTHVAVKSAPSGLQITFRIAPAEQLPLPDRSVSAVAAATAAHRFDRPAFYNEVARTLLPGGILALVHNRHRYWDSPALAEYHEFVEQCISEYRRGTFTTAAGTYSTIDFYSELGADRRFEDVNVRHWNWEFDTSLSHFLALSFSSSLIQRSASAIGKQAVTEKLTEIFERYSQKGLLRQPHVTEVTFATKTNDRISRKMSAAVLTTDLASDGYHSGLIRVPISTGRSAFGWTAIPVISVKNGNGPCALLLGGCHGDEYEGQIALRLLSQELKCRTISGQVIIIPGLNGPAVHSGSRLSPFDDGNLNTAFPGVPIGKPTQVLAHFIEASLLPRAALVVDTHSGGHNVEYACCAMLPPISETTQRERLFELARVLGMPMTFVLDQEDHNAGSIFAACERVGVSAIAAELGGGATINIDALRFLTEGILRILAYLKILREPARKSDTETILIRRLPISETVCAPESGLFQPAVNPGDEVEADQIAGWIHNIEAPWSSPKEVRFSRGGKILCRRLPVPTMQGDGLFKLGVDWR
ncbi:methyltransferase domain-containing protein [Bradyrhizobium sp. CSA207]|uniref:methyltransferase domain-containing protein n=1 Tax=Bradyrhizobium sp. CSA207 TaxID=2698826 RepID=UPI0023AFFBB5|nr:succinylglutamate desuccinylase/aspartoacylase family protein [Bradyrhizobium sp. CSA207]MDE5445201.1 methyltransferase domain-containing protein [Bradyrhizobium sp. CSA207]